MGCKVNSKACANGSFDLVADALRLDLSIVYGQLTSVDGDYRSVFV